MSSYRIDVDYLSDCLVRLLRTPSPTGNTGATIALMEEAFSRLGLAVHQTTHFYISPYKEVGHGAASGIPEEVKDSSGPYDLGMRRKLVALCRERDIPFRVDIYPQYGSDGSAALRAGADLVVGLIGPGVDASHAYERTRKDSLLHTAQLAAAYLLAD